MICRCGYGMKATYVVVYKDLLNGNIFCDVEFSCTECNRKKYIRCPMNNVLDAETEEEYRPCLVQREVLL